NAMLIGLVGKPSCGKSTFFKAATLAEVLIANYPFATIKPNHGIGYVRVECIDKEFNVQCEPRTGYCKNGVRFVPVELMDVAGLVKGASEGKGLGNQFLDDLRQADAFIHIVDISGTTDAEGKETEGYDPLNDVEMLENELNKWYSGLLKKAWTGFVKKQKSEQGELSKAIAKQFSGLMVKEEDVKASLSACQLNKDISSWQEKDIENFSRELRKRTKPMIIAANKIDKGGENLKRLKQAYPDIIVVPCSADSELALKEAVKAGLIDYLPGDKDFKLLKEVNDKQKQALEKIKQLLNKYGSTGIQDVLEKTVFELLEYIAVFPAGGKLRDSEGRILPDCYLVPKHTTALDFAYHIHTDLGKKFIKAIDARTKQAIGKDKPLKHRDGVEIVTG
ncbi:MAG: redox-regulated ATPase YchF, partial [Candidatus Nanoarchaeia archaeon]